MYFFAFVSPTINLINVEMLLRLIAQGEVTIKKKKVEKSILVLYESFYSSCFFRFFFGFDGGMSI